MMNIEASNIIIYNAQGKDVTLVCPVREKSKNKVVLSLDALEPGMYYMRVGAYYQTIEKE